MRVKDLADLAGTTVRTIRYYHHLGLLSVPEPGTTWRSYGFAHLTRLMRIRWLVESGVPLADVPHLLAAADSAAGHAAPDVAAATDAAAPHAAAPDVRAAERSLVIDDLTSVLGAIDAKLAHLTAQRARVAALLERARTRDGLSPLPESIERLYDALRRRPLPAGMRDAIERERDLLELACYRGRVPAAVVTLVEAMGEADLDELCRCWQECYEIDRASTGGRLTPLLQARVDGIVARVVDLAERAAPEPTRRLLARAVELDMPPVRAAVNLAYPSPTYRQVVSGLVALARERSAP